MPVDAAVEKTVIGGDCGGLCYAGGRDSGGGTCGRLCYAVDAALEDVAPEDAPVFVPENPDAKADDSWKRMLWNV